MRFSTTAIALLGFVAGSVLANPTPANGKTGNNGASVAGQACTDGRGHDGTCRADGRCGLEFPPNEVSFQQIGGQCGL